ncbi:MAG: ABC transporter permease [SAR202 cluster bacterium]|jgi:tungstate transport system permease protein|nr:ABC transporter permease [SAR202 cluster bacterium]
MDLVWEGIRQAFWLIVRRDPEVTEVFLLTLRVSGSATLISMCIGVPLGSLLGIWRFSGRGLVSTLVNTGMGVPPVVVGLVVTIMIWRSGPLGALGILYTPWAMVLAQVVIALPIVTGVSMAAMSQVDPRLRHQLFGLGASRLQAFWVQVQEARLPLLTAVMAGFGGVISEVGAVMMVGGNIKGDTRVLTTATVLAANRGEFGLAIALGIILLLLAFSVNLVLTFLQRKGRLQ